MNQPLLENREIQPPPQAINLQNAQAAQQLAWTLAAQSGDRQAFGKLAQCYQRQCVSVALRLLGNVHDASEVVQDSLLNSYRNLGQLQDPQRFAPWLMRIVTNVALNFRRARACRHTTSIEQCIQDDGDDLRSTLPGRLMDAPDQPLASQELGHAIRRSIDALPSRQRLALVMFAIEKMPQKDVADVLNCSVEAVKWHVCMARKQLRKSLEQYV